MKHNISLLMIVSCLTAAFQTPVFADNAAIGKSALPLSAATKRLLRPTSTVSTSLETPLPEEPSDRDGRALIEQLQKEKELFLKTIRSGMEGKGRLQKRI